ncbi:uncharacterized protein V6R79_025943 [Siganus canaliculatus]
MASKHCTPTSLEFTVHCSSKMALWWQALTLLCCILNCVESSPSSPVLQKNIYNNSFRLTRSTRTRVQQLQMKYKEQQLGNKNFEDRSRQLKDLPLLSTDFDSWLNLTDWERLNAAFQDMQAYWSRLDWKRKELELTATHGVRSALSQSIKNIQLDLRDLMNQVSKQMSTMQRSWVRPTSPTAWTSLNPQTTQRTVWDRRVEGYIILRDLDLYLTKLARDFLLLASKTRMTQH